MTSRRRCGSATRAPAADGDERERERCEDTDDTHREPVERREAALSPPPLGTAVRVLIDRLELLLDRLELPIFARLLARAPRPLRAHLDGALGLALAGTLTQLPALAHLPAPLAHLTATAAFSFELFSAPFLSAVTVHLRGFMLG